MKGMTLFVALMAAMLFARSTYAADPCDESKGCKTLKVKTLLLLSQESRLRTVVAAADVPKTYAEAVAYAESSEKPLIVLVKTDRPDLQKEPGWIVFREDAFPKPEPGIVVSSHGYWLKSLPPTASMDDVKNAIKPKLDVKLAPAPMLPKAPPPVAPMSFMALPSNGHVVSVTTLPVLECKNGQCRYR